MDKKTRIIHEIAFYLILAFVILTVGYKIYTVWIIDVPREFRETNLAAFAKAFSKGYSLYSKSILDKRIPAATNVYGFLVPLVLSPFVRLASLMGISSLMACEILCILTEALCLFLAYRIIYFRTRDRVCSIGGAAVMLSCFWRYTACGGAFPDPFGILLELLLAYLVLLDEKRGKYNPALYAFLLICMFYIKQYYFFVVLGMIAYLLLHSRKDFFRFALWGITEGVASLILINLVFPLYFTEAFPVSQGSTFNNDYLYSLRQIPEQLIRSYKLVVLIPFICLIFWMLGHKNRKPGAGVPSFFFGYEFLQCILIIFPCVVIARNAGTQYTYYLQLWWLYVILIAFQALPVMLSYFRLDGFRAVMASALVVFLCIADCRSMIVSEPLTSTEQAQWHEAYETLGAYAENGEILVSPHLSAYCLDHGIPTSDYGQAEYNSEQALRRYENSWLWTALFPDAEQIFRKNMGYEEQLKEDIRNHRFSCIALTDIVRYNLSDEEILSAGYHISKELTLVTGREEWDTVFFTLD